MVPNVQRDIRVAPKRSFGKWAILVLLNDRAILGIEFGAVAEVFMHDRVNVVNMLGAENMP
jgi:hypothetical protein